MRAIPWAILLLSGVMWLEIAGAANRAVPVNAITCKNLSPVNRDPGIVSAGISANLAYERRRISGGRFYFSM